MAMVLATALSKNNVLIRLTSERWNHIISSHIEINPDEYKVIMEVIKNPDVILQGDTGELLAVKKKSRKKLWIVVPYKEAGDDGFILTAYLTTDSHWLFQREIIWNKKL